MNKRSAQLRAAFHEPGTRIFRIVQGSIWGLILLSIMLLVVEAFLPDASRYSSVLNKIDRVVLAIFALEFLLRVGTYTPPSLKVFRRPRIKRFRSHVLARLAFVLRPIILVDLLAVLAFFPELRGLRALRLLRLLRTTRVFKYRNPFAIVLHSLEENGLLFTFAFTILGSATLLGGLSIYLVEVKANPAVNGIVDGLWWALVTITTVGYGDISPVTTLGRVIGGGMMIAGMFTLALFAGIVGSSLVTGMLSIREEQFRMSDYMNHVVVCGFDESTRLLFEALRRELDMDETKVVIVDQHERPREVPPDIAWVQGDATKESELDKVRVTHAAAVIVTGSRDDSPGVADARTILTLFTIRSYLSDREHELRLRHKPLYLVAEILDAENVDHAISAGADEVIETRRIGYSMIAHAIGYHGTAAAMSRVIMSGAYNVYLGHVPKQTDNEISYGDLLINLELSKRGGLVIGIRKPSGEDFINPPKDYRIEHGALLIYLARKPLLEPPKGRA